MKNDHDLFIRFYEEYKNKLFSYLMYRLNFNRELSEDLLMDIVLKAYEKFDSYNEQKGSFKNWIFTIAHNHLVNYWRDQGSQKTIEFEYTEINDTPQDAERKIDMDNIQKVLSIMNEKSAELLILKYIHDFDNKEISKILKRKEGAVRTGLTRATAEFKELYKKLFNN